MPDVVERTTAPRTLQYRTQPASNSPNGLDWNDFGIGAGVGIGLMLLLLGLGASAGSMRHGQRQVSNV